MGSTFRPFVTPVKPAYVGVAAMPREIVVNGLRYFIGSGEPRGFYGRAYTVRFHDGQIVRTDNLNWDMNFRTGSRQDTAVIVDGWPAKLEHAVFGWKNAGAYRVFGMVAS